MTGGHVSLYALHLGSRRARVGSVYCYDDGRRPYDLAYYCWLARGRGHTVLVDTGPSAASLRHRGVAGSGTLRQRLASLGVDPLAVDHVVLTHLHWDHTGNLDLFPRATVWAQRRELEFWEGPDGGEAVFRLGVDDADLGVLDAVRREGRLVVVDGDADVVPGVAAHLVGGHTPGSQVVTAETAEGTAVLASDVAYHRGNVTRPWPTGVFTDLPASCRALRRVAAMASHPDLVVPGHDPDVGGWYPAVAPGVHAVTTSRAAASA